MPKPSFDFRRIATAVHDGAVLTPILMNYLHSASYPEEFQVQFRNHGEERKPDGWFHPSSHPLMTKRQLYMYLTAPDKWLREPLEYMGALSVTFGTAVHGFIQMCLSPDNANVLVPPPTGMCPVCRRKTGWGLEDCNEHGVVDHVTRTRGHMDGVLNIPGFGMAGFEFKTSNLNKLHHVEDGNVEAFSVKWPEYYAQVQEYMRISGLPKFIVFFLGLGYPWTTREYIVEHDHAFAVGIAAKYRLVLAAVETQVLPEPCCAPQSKQARVCSARNVCPIGLL